MTTAETVADWMLTYSVHHLGVNEREIAMYDAYYQPVVISGWTQDDFQRGFDLALNTGWVEWVTPSGSPNPDSTGHRVPQAAVLS